MKLEPTDFDFSMCQRNLAMCEAGFKPPKLNSTGTTIVAAIYKDGVVMGADSRSTAGNLIADKHCLKVHKITDRIFACGAGTAADLFQVTKMLSANLRLQELNSGRKARVCTALRIAKQHLFKHMGYVGAYLLIGGFDINGSHLYDLSANGTSMNRYYASEGSGSYAAGAILERDFKFDMSEEECKNLVRKALESGMHGDNMSGNSLNLVTIDKNGSRFEGPFVPDFCKQPTPADLEYKFKAGDTAVLKQKTINYVVVESMDVN